MELVRLEAELNGLLAVDPLGWYQDDFTVSKLPRTRTQRLHDALVPDAESAAMNAKWTTPNPTSEVGSPQTQTANRYAHPATATKHGSKPTASNHPTAT